MRKSVVLWILISFMMLAVAGGAIWSRRAPGKLDAFAQCLKDQGAVFYGAFWCSHCQNQKALFGRSARMLPYIECSTPNGQSQTSECQDKKIAGYPTWEFKDGSRLSGELALERLAEKTGCSLSQ